MKKETAQSFGLRRWRVGECSSSASAKTRPGLATWGGGKITLLFGLPPEYTSSRKRYCSLIMKPPKNMLLAESAKRIKGNGRAFTTLNRNKFLLARTQRGVY